jgi:hypothetical protein
MDLPDSAAIQVAYTQVTQVAYTPDVMHRQKVEYVIFDMDGAPPRSLVTLLTKHHARPLDRFGENLHGSNQSVLVSRKPLLDSDPLRLYIQTRYSVSMERR